MPQPVQRAVCAAGEGPDVDVTTRMATAHNLTHACVRVCSQAPAADKPKAAAAAPATQVRATCHCTAAALPPGSQQAC